MNIEDLKELIQQFESLQRENTELKLKLSEQSSEAPQEPGTTSNSTEGAPAACPRCNGDGELKMSVGAYKKCPDCHGTGRAPASSPCPRCQGAGRMHVPCPDDCELADSPQGPRHDHSVPCPTCTGRAPASSPAPAAPASDDDSPPQTDDAWQDEDPGRCLTCGKAWELVRPGKSQPTCSCDDAPAAAPEAEGDGERPKACSRCGRTDASLARETGMCLQCHTETAKDRLEHGCDLRIIRCDDDDFAVWSDALGCALAWDDSRLRCEVWIDRVRRLVRAERERSLEFAASILEQQGCDTLTVYEAADIVRDIASGKIR